MERILKKKESPESIKEFLLKCQYDLFLSSKHFGSLSQYLSKCKMFLSLSIDFLCEISMGCVLSWAL